MSRLSPEQKAVAYLTEGKVKVVDHSLTEGRAEVEVYGTAEEPYVVRFAMVSNIGSWHCTCPAKSDRCAHLIAVKLISPLHITEWTLTKHAPSVVDDILGIDR